MSNFKPDTHRIIIDWMWKNRIFPVEDKYDSLTHALGDKHFQLVEPDEIILSLQTAKGLLTVTKMMAKATEFEVWKKAHRELKAAIARAEGGREQADH